MCGWGELYPSLFWIFGICLTLQSPLVVLFFGFIIVILRASQVAMKRKTLKYCFIHVHRKLLSDQAEIHTIVAPLHIDCSMQIIGHLVEYFLFYCDFHVDQTESSVPNLLIMTH